MNTLEQQIEKILDAVFIHGKETPEQSYDLPEGQLTIHDAIEQLTTLIKQRERDAVEGFSKWERRNNKEGILPKDFGIGIIVETYLKEREKEDE